MNRNNTRMPKRKKQKTTRKKTHVRAKPRAKAQPKREKEPDYVIQIHDPKMVRKDILESLREVIIFMQGYEKFKRIQEEKVMTIALLKDQVKELNNLVNHQLKKYLPVGKLKPTIKGRTPKRVVEDVHDRYVDHGPKTVVEPYAEEKVPIPTYKKTAPVKPKPKNELEELESQLQDIEHQLQNIH